MRNIIIALQTLLSLLVIGGFLVAIYFFGIAFTAIGLFILIGGIIYMALDELWHPEDDNK